MIAEATDFELFVLAPIGLVAWWTLRCVLNNMRDRRVERERYGPELYSRRDAKFWADLERDRRKGGRR